MEPNHTQAVKNFKEALDAMVQSREIRVDYANQLVRLMRVYLPQYAKPCGFAGAFDFVPPKTVQVARVAPIAQMAGAEPVKKNDAEPAAVDKPEPVGFEAIPTYDTTAVLQQIGADSVESITAEQADSLRALARDLAIAVGPNSKPATIISKIVEAYASA
jgi:hypothetical protein